ncbi:EAL domain-containing protein [Rhizobium sp. S-51]|uniref:EAL domain-containing protein n=1 Tax=Rhizobium terricola TaxID=2728849 RepID=A0A7Y0FYE9_9HYPH|nr:EAL domain-containing protein [Rhizobium terricola]NML76890.1 EAL domain-containing protein [Rhizobium terricola]
MLALSRSHYPELPPPEELDSDALSGENLREQMVIAYLPIVRGFLVPAICYYAIITVAHFFYETWENFLTLGGISLLTAIIAFGLRNVWLARRIDFRALEAASLTMNLLIYMNIVSFLSIHFEPTKLVYFVLLIMVCSTSGVSFRVVVLGGVVSIVTMLWMANRAGGDIFLQFAFIGLAGAFAAIGMAMLMRGAILRAVRARVTADALRRRAERQADFDALTGLPNRRNFFATLEQLMASPAAGTYVGIIDLDGFKPVNDLYGHAVGDDLLVEVSRRIRRACPPDYMVARLGGDEFALAITRPLSEDALMHLGTAICEALRRPFTISDIPIAISGSIGFAHYPTNGVTARQIYERADHALYCAKRATRGDVVIFTERHEAEMSDCGRIEQTLRNADLVRELCTVFQPQYDILKGSISGFEALARWNSPTLGLVNPGLFIAAAERTGMIERVTGILLEKALAAAVTWPEGITLSFNLSPLDLVSARSITNVMRIVRESGIAPERMTFEITESVVVSDFERARDSLVALADMGCKIALDDFGAGYSSFGYIHRFPLHRIKTDRCFVTRLAEDNVVGLNILRAIAELCANLGVECLAEGIETEEELRSVQSAGIRFVQGYLHGRPMGAAEAAELIAARGEGEILAAAG